jgi:hypothetical protein
VNVPVPPVGAAAVSGLGVLPAQMVCGEEVITLLAIFGFTETPTAADVSLQLPEITIRLNHVVVVRTPEV